MSGVSGDLRDVEKAAKSGNIDALNAIRSYAYSIKKYIGQYAAVLNGVDSICFAGGIGENSPAIREMSLEGLDYLGVKLDRDKNLLSAPNSVISSSDSKVRIHLIRTDEEIVVARKAYMLLSENKQ
jgi:acetate kinase